MKTTISIPQLARAFGFYPMLALVFGASFAHAQPSVVGDATMVIGVARVFSSEAAGAVIQRGTVVREGDRIETEAGGHVQIRFVDGGRISVRPSSRLQIENYSHSEQQPSLNSIKFRLDEGVVRSITGAWGEAARDKFRLNTPVAAIGVKGTDFVVTADANKTFAAVYTGAIILAPLSDACRTTLGPCLSGFEKSLTEQMKGQMIALYRQDISPQIVALADELALRRSKEAVPVAAAADRPNQANRGPSAAATAPADKPIIADSNPTKGPDAPTVTTPPVVVVVPEPPPVAPILPPQVKQLAWAASPWAKPISGDTLSQAFSIVKASGKTGIVGNGAYSLYRDPSSTNILITSEATATFRLAGGVGQLLMAEGRILEPVKVTDGTLTVDFGRATFDTTLNMAGATLGAHSVVASGVVSHTGVMLGQTGNAYVAGAVSLDGKEAGYFFEKALPVGNLSGFTIWGL